MRSVGEGEDLVKEKLEIQIALRFAECVGGRGAGSGPGRFGERGVVSIAGDAGEGGEGEEKKVKGDFATDFAVFFASKPPPWRSIV